jgi:hypothetical protein
MVPLPPIGIGHLTMLDIAPPDFVTLAAESGGRGGPAAVVANRGVMTAPGGHARRAAVLRSGGAARDHVHGRRAGARAAGG